MADPEIIKHIALRTGLGINYISKDAKITEVLEQLKKLFSFKTLILKGGTAINRGYLEEPKRFSEDLDIDYISNEQLNEKLEYIKQIIKEIKGFQLDKPALMHQLLRFDCHYINEFNQKDIVRVEFYLSHNELVAVNEPKEELLKSNLETTRSCLFRIYSLEDIIARKLLTLHNRTEGKDMYDVFYLLDLKYDPNQLKKALELILIAYNQQMTVEKFIAAIIKNLVKSLDHAFYIGNSTNHYLTKSYRPNWKEFIATLQQKVEDLERKLIK